MTLKLKHSLSILSALLNAIWLFMPAFVTVCLIYYCLMAVDLTVDTLMMTGEHWWKLFAVLLPIFFWSWVVWFSSRIMSLVPVKRISKANEDDEGVAVYEIEKNCFIDHMPRFLAINCFVALETSILALKHVINMSGWWIVLFIACQLFFYILLNRAYNLNIKLKEQNKGKDTTKERNQKSTMWWVAQSIGICYIICLIILSIWNYHYHKTILHSWRLPILCILLYLTQLLCMHLFSSRRGFVDHPDLFDSIFKKFLQKLQTFKLVEWHIWLLKKLGLKKEDAEKEGVYYMLFQVVFIVGFIAYFVSIRYIGISSSLGPLAFTILALGVLVSFFNLIGALSRRIDFNLNIVLILWACIIGNAANTHQVRTTAATFEDDTIRLTASQFLDKWLDNPIRNQAIAVADSAHPYYAYIVLSDGGGARAATWSALLLSKLEDASNKEFGKHLFSIAGASGGSVGNTAFYGLLRAEQRATLRRPNDFYHHASPFFSGDFLTYTTGRFFGPDFFNYLFPFISINDRAAALENTFERGSNDSLIANFFAASLDSSYDYSGRLPAFFINTMEVNNGLTAFVSNVRLRDNLRTDVLSKICPDKTIRVSTAAILSARFPFISPAGELNGHYFVDGGYSDNSGAGTTLEFMKEVYDSLPATLKKKIKFQVIELHNSEVTVKPFKPIAPLVNDLLVPLLALYHMQDGSTEIGNHLLKTYMSTIDRDQKPIRFDLYIPDEKESYPMSWINSEYQLERIRKHINNVEMLDTNFKHIVTNWTE